MPSSNTTCSGSKKDSPRIIIVHGTMGSPLGNWFPWLVQQLRDKGLNAVAPRFPTPENQSLATWLECLSQEVGSLRPQDILVGHSIGAAFCLRILERLDFSISATILVSGFCKELGNPNFDSYNFSFVAPPFSWAAIRQNSKRFILYNGVDDPYVPIELGRELADRLGAPLSEIAEGGHLNTESGFTEFEPALREIEAILKV